LHVRASNQLPGVEWLCNVVCRGQLDSWRVKPSNTYHRPQQAGRRLWPLHHLERCCVLLAPFRLCGSRQLTA
jgi:hypothetical protein